MKKLLVTLDDDLAKELERFPNKSEVIRKATRLYVQHILTDELAGMRTGYKVIGTYLQEIDKKIDYIAGKL